MNDTELIGLVALVVAATLIMAGAVAVVRAVIDARAGGPVELERIPRWRPERLDGLHVVTTADDIYLQGLHHRDGEPVPPIAPEAPAARVDTGGQHAP